MNYAEPQYIAIGKDIIGTIEIDILRLNRWIAGRIRCESSHYRENTMNKLLLTLLLVLVSITTPSFANPTYAPPVTLADAAGNDVTLPSKKDGVDIYLFWASWCPYCKALMPHLQSMQIEYGDDVRVYALNIRDDEDPVEFMAGKGYDFILLPDADPVMELYGVKSTPAVFVVDSDGAIRFNLYKMIFNDSDDFKALSHREKSGLRAPYWSAEIRRSIDKVLAEPAND